MRSRSLFLCLSAALILLASTPARADEASDVVVLTKSSFKKAVDDEKPVLVEFYAPWCGHCKALTPEYEKAATQLKASGIQLAKVDCTVEEAVCKDNGVQGYPTLKIFRSGTPVDYQGPRKADSIVSYMKKQLLPALSEVTAKNAESFVDSDNVVVVGFFKSTDSKEYQALLSVANKLRDSFIFGATVDSSVVSKYSASTPSVILFKKFDEGKNTYSGTFSEDALTKFIQTSSVPLMDELGSDNYGKYVETGLPLAYLFVTSDEDKATYGPIIEAIAKTYKGKINFVHIDANKYGGHGKGLGLDTFPGVVIQVPEANLKYVYEQTKKITKKDLEAFVKDFDEGKLEPSFKSQAVPEQEFEGDVRVLVGKTFADVVLDKSKDVFVEFYAPWCGHCKKLAPTWETLGEKFKKSGVVIAKMDATENDIPPESPLKAIDGYPTLVLFKADDKNEIATYNGDRSLDSLVEFVEKHAVNKTGISVSAGDIDSEPAVLRDEL